jgi:hypothetical protein
MATFMPSHDALSLHNFRMLVCPHFNAVVPHAQAEMAAKAKEAELNARVLSLESQIHWLGEQNTQLAGETVAAS